MHGECAVKIASIQLSLPHGKLQNKINNKMSE